MIDYDKADIKQWVNTMLDGKKIYKRLVKEIKKTVPKLKKVKDIPNSNLMSKELGVFTFDEENNWFSNDYDFEGSELVLNLFTNNLNKEENILSIFEKLLYHINEIEVISRGYAINQIVEMNEDLFLNNINGADLLEEIAGQITLECIGMYENENLAFWYYYEKNPSDGRVIMIKFTADELLGKLAFLGLA